MKLCYIDESGGIEAPDSSYEATPAMVIVGLVVDADKLASLTRDFTSLKIKHFPAKFRNGRSLDLLLTEIKGTQILGLTRDTGRNKRRQARQFRVDLLTLLRRHEVKLMSRIWVKADGVSLDVRRTYGYAIQDMAKHFDHCLSQSGEMGMIIADSREHGLNVNVAHSVYTQKFRAGGDPYPFLGEVPVFAASDNHAGLQLADLVASTLLFPSAIAAYAEERSTCVHKPSLYEPVRAEFVHQVKALSYRYKAEDGFWRAGIDLTDARANRPTSLMFRGSSKAN